MTFSPTKDYEHSTNNIDESVGAPSKAASPIDSAVWVEFLDSRIQKLTSEPGDQAS